MNKNILKVTLVAAIALFAGYNLSNSQKTVELSDLALANVEALAGGEDADKFETKEKFTWTEGPYEERGGNEVRKYIYIYEETNCYGKGYVECSYEINSEIKYL